MAEERILDLLLPPRREKRPPAEAAEKPLELVKNEQEDEITTRQKLRKLLREHKLDERMVELEITQRTVPMVEIFSAAGMEEMDINIKDMFGNLFPKKSRKRKVKIGEALEIVAQEESQRLIDMEKVTKQAIQRVEGSRIIFLDEIDKIVGKNGTHGPDVSREGVQRDLLFTPETKPDSRMLFRRNIHEAIRILTPYLVLDNDPYVGCVVPDELRENWKLLRGPDRQRIPPAIKLAGTLNLCHYDSDKSYSGRLWTYPRLWEAFCSGGLFISDDIGDNMGFADFARMVAIEPVIVRSSEKYVGILVKR